MITVAARTVSGPVREHNEDAFLVGEMASWECGGSNDVRHDGERPLVLLVCDGMGGASAGEVASELAIETIRADLAGIGPWSDRRLGARVEDALCRANAAIHSRSNTIVEERGMGSTATAALIRGDRLHLAQVGDSRAYLLRGGTLRQITRDQSLVGMLVDADEMSAAEARTHPGQNILLQALGPRASVSPAISTVHLCQGDRLLLCSDGLVGALSDTEIGALIDRRHTAPEAADALLRRAVEAVADDNVTVIVMDADGGALPAPREDSLVVDLIKIYRPGDDPSPSAIGRWLRKLRTGFGLQGSRAAAATEATVRRSEDRM